MSYIIRDAMFSKINSINLYDRIFNLVFSKKNLFLVYHMDKGTMVVNDANAEKLIISYKLNFTEFKKFLSKFKNLKNDFEDMDEYMEGSCDLKIVI